MRLVHFSDTHLGFRQYTRLTARGINQREADVADSFSRAIGDTIALRPELVVIAGDVFHQPRPSNLAIKHAYSQFARLRAALPATEIVMVEGNHDTPRTAEAGSISGLFSSLGLHVIDGPAQTLDFPALDLSVLAVADNRHPRPELAPSGSRRYNVLLLHGEAVGISPKGSPAAERELSPEDMHADAWDYIALGHYHVYREIAANCFYSGAIDYTSSNIWGELAEERERGLPGKGVVERDLVTGSQSLRVLPASRRILDLPPIDADGMGAADLDAAIAAAVESECIADACVRLVVHNVPRELEHALDVAAIREYRADALDFNLDCRRPEVIRAGIAAGRARRQSIDELMATALAARELPSDVDRAALVARGLAYLDEARDVDVQPAALLEA